MRTDRPAIATFKSDRRSRVWREERPDGARVVKRFEHWPLRQLLALAVGLHPAQRELRRNRWLSRLGLPVAPVVEWGLQRSGLGCKVWIATPYVGRSLQELLQELLRSPPPAKSADRPALAMAVADLAAGLIRRRILFRDLKTSNLIVDGQNRVWLIDVGSARRCRANPATSRGRRRYWKMLRMLNHTARQDGATPAERKTAWRRIRQAFADPAGNLSVDPLTR